MDCSNVKKITDVTDQIDYNDTNGSGKGDAKWVSCGQDSSYNELQDKFDKHFDGITEESWVSKLMCECCKKLKPTGKEKVHWSEFYQCMISNVTDKTPNTLQVLQNLIVWHKARE